MKVSYATKRNVNGNRNVLIIDYSNKEFSTSPSNWFTKEDFIQITKRELDKLRKMAIKNEYKRIDHLTVEIM